MKKLTQQEFQQHLNHEHQVSPLSTYLREIVYGGMDGIVTTFAVIAGFSGAQALNGDLKFPVLTVLLFGFANLFADATSMGLGNFLSVRADQDVYKKEHDKEMHEVEHNVDFEKAETRHMLAKKGFTDQQATQLTDIYATNKKYWTEFMMKEELDMPNPLATNPFLTGLATTTSFMAFGAIPLIPYVFLKNIAHNTFFLSVIFTFSALMCVGFLRWKVTTQSFLRSVGETIFVGGLSAMVAYAVGTFFRL